MKSKNRKWNDRPLPSIADWDEGINRILLEKLFSDDMPDEMFENFANRFAVMLLKAMDVRQFTISFGDPDLRKMAQKIKSEARESEIS